MDRQHDKEVDPFEQLCALLDDAGAKMTFSRHCRSGIVGRDMCRCWRCRGEAGPASDESAAERDAALIDAAKKVGFRLARSLPNDADLKGVGSDGEGR